KPRPGLWTDPAASAPVRTRTLLRVERRVGKRCAFSPYYTAKFMSRSILLAPLLLLSAAIDLRSHDPSVNPITWNREISRIFFARCASCHHSGGTAFSMMTYPEAQPHATAIKESVLARRMPPWGAVKGFGEFRNDQGLSPEELDLIANWVDGG